MAAPTFQALGAGIADSAGSITLGWPLGSYAIGDVAIIVIETSGDGTTLPITPQTGWAHVTGSPFVDVASAAGTKMNVLWKRATSTSEASFTSGDSGDHQEGQIFIIRGCIATGNPWDVLSGGGDSTSNTSLVWPTVTTTGANRLILLIASRSADNSSNTFIGTPTNTNLSGITLIGHYGSVTGNGGGYAMFYGSYSSIGSIGTSSNTMTAASGKTYLTIAMKPPEVAGSLSVTGSGSDAFAASGTAGAGTISGSMAAVGSGADALAASGTVPRTGALAATEAGADIFAGLGAVTGALAATESGADGFSGSGTVLVHGSAAAIEAGADVLSGSGSVLVQGALAASESGADTLAVAGAVPRTGALQVAESGGDVLAGAGAVIVRGALAAVGSGSDVAAVSGAVPRAGSVDAAESGPDILAATGTAIGGQISGSIAADESGADALAASGSVLVRGSVTAAEAGTDVFSASGANVALGVMAAVEAGADSFAAAGAVPRTGAAAATEGAADSLVVGGKVLVLGIVASSESAADTFAASWTTGAVSGSVAAISAAVYLLANKAELVAAVPTDRIMAGILPQGAALPSVGVTHVVTLRRNLVGATGKRLCTERVQVTVMAGDYPSQKSILALVRSALPRSRGSVNGIDVDSVISDVEGPDFGDPDAGIYMGSHDFQITFNE